MHGLGEPVSGERMDHVSPAQCWALLRTATVGRLAVVTEEGADIFPINYVVDHGTVVFRTAAGTKLVAALANDRVALEADGVDTGGNMAWSVIVKGRAAEIAGLHATLDTFDLPLLPWHESPKNRFIRIDPGEVTGRRFPITDPDRWANPLSGAHRAGDE